jgi:hypothetical protein
MLRMFEYRVLRNAFESKGRDKRRHKEESYDL